MQYFTTNNIRKKFLNYFGKHNHALPDPSSLIPHNDPTLLFINAGMNQFKNVFLGTESLPYNTAATSQGCVRAGGKHNDLDNVGYTDRHHTYFEMLGNFSFGDYFKEQAIVYSWNFLTVELQIPKDRLWITVFEDDLESEEIWINKIGVPKSRVTRIGAADNFWSMGDTGPCGPCSEIFYDHGEHLEGGAPGTPTEDLGRYVEIWNLVFMQYNRLSDGTLEDLPKPSVDTGMGLERIAAVVQNVFSNYDIDLFVNLIGKIANLLGVKDLSNPSLRVIADHIRSCAFLIADGVNPSNDGRGYVLRRIIRRAIRHGNKLGCKEPFFHKIVAFLIEAMDGAASNLVRNQAIVVDILLAEEQQFIKTLDRGLGLLEEELSGLKANTISGEVVFKLYDTYGFPVDLTNDYCREQGIELDLVGFEKCMQEQRERASSASKFGKNYNENINTNAASNFIGYDKVSCNSKVLEIYVDNNSVQSVDSNQQAVLILDKTVFYPESGGQVGDVGTIHVGTSLFKVQNTVKLNKAISHHGVLESGEIKVGDTVNCLVVDNHREGAAMHHTATHLLHAALRNTLGKHIEQKGSLVKSNLLRFDFSHNKSIPAADIMQIELLINKIIHEDLAVTTEVMSIDEAKNSGAMALFGEKYDANVRVVSVGDFSKELCGGTHVSSISTLKYFKIISEKSIAAGVRRIEAVVNSCAIDYVDSYIASKVKNLIDVHESASTVAQKCNILAEKLNEQSSISVAGINLPQTGFDDISNPELFINKFYSHDKAIREQIIDFEALHKENNQALKKLNQKKSVFLLEDLAKQAVVLQGVNVLIKYEQDLDKKIIKTLIDSLKNKLQPCVVLLATKIEANAIAFIGVSPDLADKVPANALVANFAKNMNAKGGGRADFAQIGGIDADNLDSFLLYAEKLIDLEITK